MLAAFAWTGIFLAIASLRTMQTLVKNLLGWFLSWIFVGGVLTLAGIGIYL
jgi:predicted membrane channel-forming protein YqfA (hemolysin III family)